MSDDLAGATGQQLKEATSINASLSALGDVIGDELSMIMMVAPVVLMVVWFLVVLLYKGEPPPTFDPPIDINKEFGKHYFQSPETIQKEEASSRTIRLPRDASLEESIVKVVD